MRVCIYIHLLNFPCFVTSLHDHNFATWRNGNMYNFISLQGAQLIILS